MNYQFSQRAQNLIPSGVGQMMRYAAKYDDVISLGQGTPQYATPQFIFEELARRAQSDERIGMYSSKKIELKLKEEIIKDMNHLYGFAPKIEEIELTTGGVGGLFAAFQAFLEEGDEVIYLDPSYPYHIGQMNMTGAVTKFVPFIEEKGWKLDLEKLKSSVNEKTKMIVLTNPNNPTGTVLNESEVREIADIVIKNDLLLILDAAYDFLVYTDNFFSPMQIEELRSRIILSKSFSKEFSMTGWRIGYVYASAEIVTKLYAIHSHFSICPPTPSIIAAEIALSDPRGHEFMEFLVSEMRESREVISNRLDKLKNLFEYVKPDGAFYVFPRILGLVMDTNEFCKLLIDEVKVITVPGISSGPAGSRHIRMSFSANKDYINNAFDRIDEFAKSRGLL